MEITQKFRGVYIINGSIATKNIAPQIRVYGEKLIKSNDKEYRIWDPRRSKLAAAILNDIKTFPIENDSKIFYLGASSGTTSSHISDIAIDGLVYCVEFSPRMMRNLVDLCSIRENMIPLLEDATKPRNYIHLVEKVDVVYCDVAQPKQSELFMDNMRLFLKEDGIGIIMIKSRSIDVTKNPKKVFKEEESKIKTSGFRIIEKIDLVPYKKDHMAFVCGFSF